MIPVFIVILVAAAALFSIEGWYISRGEPTISARLQSANARMGTQLVAGIFFLLGAVAGFLVAHFASTPPA